MTTNKWSKTGQRASGVIIILILALGLGACSAAPSAPNQEGSKATTAVAPSAPGAAPQPGRAASDSSAGSAAIPPASQNASQTLAQGNQTIPFDRMIIRTVTLSLIVKDVEGTITAARDLANAGGGFVAQSNSRYDGDHQVATITIQVPATQFDSTVDALRRLAVKVDTENGTTQDVTEEYSDLEAQVRNLQATEAGLQRLMDKATRMEDIIALQRELTNVRGQIEQRQGRLNFLSRRTAMSTISLSLRPEALAKTSTQAWQPLETARRAWEASAAMLAAAANVLIAVVVFLWWLVPLAVIGLYVLRNRRMQRRERPAQ